MKTLALILITFISSLASAGININTGSYTHNTEVFSIDSNSSKEILIKVTPGMVYIFSLQSLSEVGLDFHELASMVNQTASTSSIYDLAISAEWGTTDGRVVKLKSIKSVGLVRRK